MNTGNVGIVAFIMTILLLNFFYRPHRSGSDYDEASILGNEYEIPYVSDSLPHYIYKRLKDSIDNANAYKQEKEHTTGSGWGVGFIGLGNAAFINNNISNYYAKIEQYKPEEGVEFYEKENMNYLRRIIWDKKEVIGGRRSWVGHYESAPTPIKFVETNKNSGSGEVLIPVSKLTHDIIEAIVIVATIAGIAICLFVFYHFIKLLIRIARGKIFDEKNIQVLFYISWYLIALGAISIVSKTICYFIFKSKIPPVLDFQFFELVLKSSTLLVTGLLILLLARIFKRGYELQQEQALTV